MLISHYLLQALTQFSFGQCCPWNASQRLRVSAFLAMRCTSRLCTPTEQPQLLSLHIFTPKANAHSPVPMLEVQRDIVKCYAAGFFPGCCHILSFNLPNPDSPRPSLAIHSFPPSFKSLTSLCGRRRIQADSSSSVRLGYPTGCSIFLRFYLFHSSF